jgi:hypothetical protein
MQRLGIRENLADSVRGAGCDAYFRFLEVFNLFGDLEVFCEELVGDSVRSDWMRRWKGGAWAYLCDLAWWLWVHRLETADDVGAAHAREGENNDGRCSFSLDVLW